MIETNRLCVALIQLSRASTNIINKDVQRDVKKRCFYLPSKMLSHKGKIVYKFGELF